MIDISRVIQYYIHGIRQDVFDHSLSFTIISFTNKRERKRISVVNTGVR